MANPLIFMLHDGRALPEGRGELVDVEFDALRELREIWHREDFGEHTETETFHTQARDVAELGARAIVVGADAAAEVWICAERDDRPRRLYERLGFSVVVETGAAILPPKP